MNEDTQLAAGGLDDMLHGEASNKTAAKPGENACKLAGLGRGRQ